MDLSISNIAWTLEDDEKVYELMTKYGFGGLEIAPTRIFPENPYDRLSEAEKWSKGLLANYNIRVSSMQSIWYGQQGLIFASENDNKKLLDYTKKAIDFAEAIGCNNLVFGCPKNRCVPDNMEKDMVADIEQDFFGELGDYAYKHGTVLSMEANPPIYNTNYVNETKLAIELVKKVNSKGFLLNLDVGTMIANDETIDVLDGASDLINHVHISEPGLKTVEERELHSSLVTFLKNSDYSHFVSVEMGRQPVEVIDKVMKYISQRVG